MEEIYKNSLLLIHSLTQLSGLCYKFEEEVTEANVEKIISQVDNCEKKFLKVKEEVVKMVQEIESKEIEQKSESEISVIKTDSGYLIKE